MIHILWSQVWRDCSKSVAIRGKPLWHETEQKSLAQGRHFLGWSQEGRTRLNPLSSLSEAFSYHWPHSQGEKPLELRVNPLEMVKELWSAVPGDKVLRCLNRFRKAACSARGAQTFTKGPFTTFSGWTWCKLHSDSFQGTEHLVLSCRCL